MVLNSFKLLPKLRLFDYRRILIELLFAFIISVLLVFLLNDNGGSKILQLRGVGFSAAVLVLLCEGIFIFDSIISERYPWHKAVRKRVVSLFLFAFCWLAVVGKFAAFIAKIIFGTAPSTNGVGDLGIAITIYILFAIVYVVVLIGHNYHTALGSFVVENERLNRLKLEMDYSALQDQLNPHFLFNNLSTLMALIKQDADMAVKFAADFTDVYRYVIKSTKQKTVSLGDELTFIRAYLDIHKQRLGNGLEVNVSVDSQFFKRKIPPLCLQFLVENAIKHNVAVENKPLVISIFIDKNRLCVVNNLQPKTSTYSTNTGLSNLKNRYQYLVGKQDVNIFSDDDFFRVDVPLL